MHVFLRALIDELMQLWDEGVVVKVVVLQNDFKLHAAFAMDGE